MLDPYRILNVGKNTSDLEVRQNYLKLAQKYTPDRHPKKFEKIRTAYEKISTLYNRLSFDMLDSSMPNKEDVYDLLTENDVVKPPSIEQFIKLLSTAFNASEEEHVNRK